MTFTHEPGTIRTIHYYAGRVDDGRYPITYWGSVDEQIAEATLANARHVSRQGHDVMPLYTWSEDCGHATPEDDDRFRDVDDLIDEWMRRNAPCLTWRDGDLFWKNRARAEATVPLYVEWRAAQDVYDDAHGANVCLDSPMGTCCAGCTDGDGDVGYDIEPCRLADRVKDAYDEFWWQVSPDAVEYRKRKDAER